MFEDLRLRDQPIAVFNQECRQPKYLWLHRAGGAMVTELKTVHVQLKLVEAINHLLRIGQIQRFRPESSSQSSYFLHVWMGCRAYKYTTHHETVDTIRNTDDEKSN